MEKAVTDQTLKELVTHERELLFAMNQSEARDVVMVVGGKTQYTKTMTTNHECSGKIPDSNLPWEIMLTISEKKEFSTPYEEDK